MAGEKSDTLAAPVQVQKDAEPTAVASEAPGAKTEESVAAMPTPKEGSSESGWDFGDDAPMGADEQEKADGSAPKDEKEVKPH